MLPGGAPAVIYPQMSPMCADFSPRIPRGAEERCKDAPQELFQYSPGLVLAERPGSRLEIGSVWCRGQGDLCWRSRPPRKIPEGFQLVARGQAEGRHPGTATPP